MIEEMHRSSSFNDDQKSKIMNIADSTNDETSNSMNNNMSEETNNNINNKTND